MPTRSKRPYRGLVKANEVLATYADLLQSAGEHGDPIPEPRYRPAIYAAGSKG